MTGSMEPVQVLLQPSSSYLKSETEDSTTDLSARLTCTPICTDIKQLSSKYVHDVCNFTNTHLKSHYSLGFFLQFLYSPNSICLFIQSNNKIVGAISGSLETRDNQGHIYTLAIDPGYRRQGFGSRLIRSFEQYMLKYARQLSTDNLSLVLELKVPQSLSYDLRKNFTANTNSISPEDSYLFYSFLLSADSMPAIFYSKLGFIPWEYLKGMYGYCADGLRMLKTVDL